MSLNSITSGFWRLKPYEKLPYISLVYFFSSLRRAHDFASEGERNHLSDAKSCVTIARAADESKNSPINCQSYSAIPFNHQLWPRIPDQQLRRDAQPQRKQRYRRVSKRYAGSERTTGSLESSLPATLRWKDVAALQPNKVHHNMTQLLNFLDVEMHQASQGELLCPVPLLLQRIGKLHKRYPSVRAAFHHHSRNSMLRNLLHSQCNDSSVYSSELSVSQLASAQASIGLYSDTFWEQLARQQIVFGHFLSAVTTVHAYASLHDGKLAPPAPDDLQHVLLAAIEQHLQSQNTLGLSNACWALSKLQIPGWDRLWPSIQQCVARVCQNSEHMQPEEVACLAYALGIAQKPLGYAQGPFLSAVASLAPRMNAKQVSRVLRAFASMQLYPGKAYSSLMKAVEREVCSPVMSTSLLPYQVVTLTAFADSQLPVCGAHESLACSLQSSIQNMTPAFVAATLLACGKMHELGATHQRLVQPLKEPVLDALKVSASRMHPRAVCNAAVGAARLNCSLGEARLPLAQAIAAEARYLSPWCLSGTLMSCAMLQHELGDCLEGVVASLTVALQATDVDAWQHLKATCLGHRFWAVGMLKIDPGEACTGRMLSSFDNAEGLSEAVCERVFVGLNWMQELYEGHALEQQVVRAMSKVQEILTQRGKE